MKIDRCFRPELCVSKTGDHENAYLDTTEPGNVCLIATDGRVLVVIPAVLEGGDSAGVISPAAIVTARKLAEKKRLAETTLGANASYLFPDGSRMPRAPGITSGTMPPWREILPAYVQGTEGTVTLRIDATCLARLAKAMGAEICALTFPVCAPDADMTELVLVTVDGSSATGALAPCRRKA